MRSHSRRRTVRVFAALALTVSVCLATGVGSAAAASNAVVVPRPPGGGAPVPGSGMGTQAALSDPQCHTGGAFSPYGEWHSSTIGIPPGTLAQPPTCVKPFKAGESNGGATSPGVTATAIKWVLVMPTADREAKQTTAAASTNLATGKSGTLRDAAHDWLVANMNYYQTWGRNLDVTYYTSTGADETSQRADLVAVKALHPFVVVNFDTDGLTTLMKGLTQAKIITFTFAITGAERAAQAPYSWGGTDADSAAVNTAEVVGKDLAGKKAQYAGGDLTSQTRKFGLVTIDKAITTSRYLGTLKKYGAPAPAVTSTYPSTAGAFGDAAASQQYAPTFVTKMKAAGVTTVVMFADIAMNTALMAQADAQNWYPEWFLGGFQYGDLPILAQGYSKTQSVHTFGITFIPPYYKLPPAVDNISGVLGSFVWFFGPNAGTTSRLSPDGMDAILAGIQNAGPKLTPQTFQQGLFAQPRTPNPNKSPLVTINGFGRNTGLPYDAYSAGPADFAPVWLDPNSKCVSLGSDSPVNMCSWYPSNGARYMSGGWPKNIVWFDKSNSISKIDPIPANAIPAAAAPCPANACPSSGASGPLPGAPSGDSFTVTVNTAVRGVS